MDSSSIKKNSINSSFDNEKSKRGSTASQVSNKEKQQSSKQINVNKNNQNLDKQDQNIRRSVEKKQHYESDSNLSDTSAVVRMNQSIKKKILRNHLMLILLLNLVQIGSLLFGVVWPAWYDDSNNKSNVKQNSAGDSVDYETKYGLLLNFKDDSVHVNSFENENNKEIGGMSSFIMFSLGIVIQLIYLFQLLAFFKSYPQSIQKRGCKILKFKTCRWLCLFLYIGAVSYWIIVVFLVQIVSDTYNFNQLCYGFWIAVGCIASFMLINIYFNFLKKQIRKNDLVSNLLNANRYLTMDDDRENVEDF